MAPAKFVCIAMWGEDVGTAGTANVTGVVIALVFRNRKAPQQMQASWWHLSLCVLRHRWRVEL